MPEPYPTEPITQGPDLVVQTKHSSSLRWLLAFVGFVILLALFSWYLINQLIFTPANNFPVNQPITIEAGTSAKSAAALLAENGYIRSELALYLSLIWWYDPSSVKADTYLFVEPLSAKELAYEITTGHFGNDLSKLTLIEGERVTQIASRAAALLPDFAETTFIELATPYEGRLFPDTYFIRADYTAEDLFTLLRETFNEKTNSIKNDLANHPLGEDGVLILASIIEREANTATSMRLVSSVLQNRLAIGMALQADASIEYILNKPLQDLVPSDLEIDSPYNTYLYPGLPPSPIGNPGLDAIMAVLNPAVTDYFYYLTDAEGNFHFAEDFDQHRLNIARYLR